MPEDEVPGVNIYDMRLTRHEDGWIYGLFCVERHDDSQPGNLSAATATCGIARTKDLVNWERLPDLKSRSQQRNVVLHPEFVDGKYALYTVRRMDLSMQAAGAVSAGRSSTTSLMLKSRKSSSWTAVIITPSRR